MRIQPARRLALLLATLGLLATSSAAMARDWNPSVENKSYSISGSSGMQLYQSIGDRGPAVGVQAIAYTTFKLTWRRDYQPQKDGSCILKTAKPTLKLIYMLPKPASKLPADVAASWGTFVSGVDRHEQIHGEHIIDMVEQIQAFSEGLRAENDKQCQKVRGVLQKRLGELSNEQRARGRAFDKDEHSPGGNVHQLILALVNGP